MDSESHLAEEGLRSTDKVQLRNWQGCEFPREHDTEGQGDSSLKSRLLCSTWAMRKLQCGRFLYVGNMVLFTDPRERAYGDYMWSAVKCTESRLKQEEMPSGHLGQQLRWYWVPCSWRHFQFQHPANVHAERQQVTCKNMTVTHTWEPNWVLRFQLQPGPACLLVQWTSRRKESVNGKYFSDTTSLSYKMKINKKITNESLVQKWKKHKYLHLLRCIWPFNPHCILVFAACPLDGWALWKCLIELFCHLPSVGFHSHYQESIGLKEEEFRTFPPWTLACWATDWQWEPFIWKPIPCPVLFLCNYCCFVWFP